VRTALITGGAGFIGSHMVGCLLAEGWRIVALDNFDPLYDRTVKLRNLHDYTDCDRFSFLELDVRDRHGLEHRLTGAYDVIVHLAAKAGVGASLENPLEYQDVNIRGTQNLLDLARMWGVKQFIFASSSTVYGLNPRTPWSEEDLEVLPVSPYAVTKVCAEHLGRIYSYLYGIRFLALRLFSIYGPRQRPDLVIHRFARRIRCGKPVPVYGDGTTVRDYTFIEDAARGIRAAMDYEKSPFEVFNIGSSREVSLIEVVRALANVSGLAVRYDYCSRHSADVPRTLADIRKAKRLLGYEPATGFEDGLYKFWMWFADRTVQSQALGAGMAASW